MGVGDGVTASQDSQSSKIIFAVLDYVLREWRNDRKTWVRLLETRYWLLGLAEVNSELPILFVDFANNTLEDVFFEGVKHVLKKIADSIDILANLST